MNIENQNGYMLLYRSDEWYNKLSRQELHSLMDQNKAWIEKLTAQGKVKPGRALERKGAIVSGKSGRFVTDALSRRKPSVAIYWRKSTRLRKP